MGRRVIKGALKAKRRQQSSTSFFRVKYLIANSQAPKNNSQAPKIEGEKRILSVNWAAVFLLDLTYETYTQWVIDRAVEYRMPYPLPRYLSSTNPELPLPLLPSTQEKYQEKMADLNRVCNTWKRKYEEAMSEVGDKDVEILQFKHELLNKERQLIEKNAQIQAQSATLAQFISKKECMDFFAGAHPDFEE